MPTPPIPAPEIIRGAYLVPDELRDAYHLALGRFMDAFGHTEAWLSASLDQFVSYRIGVGSGDARQLSRLLLGSKRTKEASDMIQAVLRIIDAASSERALAKDALDQLQHIQHVRDRLAHNGGGMEFIRGEWIIRSSNHTTVREEVKISELRLTVEAMDSMTADLWTIRSALHLIMLPAYRFDEGQQQRAAPVPWQYKPSSPVSRPKRIRTKTK